MDPLEDHRSLPSSVDKKSRVYTWRANNLALEVCNSRKPADSALVSAQNMRFFPVQVFAISFSPLKIIASLSLLFVRRLELDLESPSILVDNEVF